MGMRGLLGMVGLALVLSGVAPSVGAAPADRPRVSALLADLSVAPENASGYERDLFPHWNYLGDGCDVRDAVLIAEALSGPRVEDDCDIVRGRWISRFDGITVRDPSRLDVDHLVPLAEAWGSGARNWDTLTRSAFANDVDYPRTLIAVTASSNRSKGDQDPAEWLPPRVAYRCTYAADWIGVKYRWRLSVDPEEEAALRVLVNSCGDPRITLPPRAR